MASSTDHLIGCYTYQLDKYVPPEMFEDALSSITEELADLGYDVSIIDREDHPYVGDVLLPDGSIITTTYSIVHIPFEEVVAQAKEHQTS